VASVWLGGPVRCAFVTKYRRKSGKVGATVVYDCERITKAAMLADMTARRTGLGGVGR
jgi:hypothetical protein